MMIVKGPRELLLELAIARTSPFGMGDYSRTSSESLRPESGGITVGLDGDTASAQPPAFIVVSGELRDFFAWTNTYLPHWAPLTATTLVVQEGDIWQIDLRTSKPDPVPFQLRKGLAGLVLAQTMISAKDAVGEAYPTLARAKETAAYAMARVISVRSQLSLSRVISKLDEIGELFERERVEQSERIRDSVWLPISRTLGTVSSHWTDSSPVDRLLHTQLVGQPAGWDFAQPALARLHRTIQHGERREVLIDVAERTARDLLRTSEYSEVVPQFAYLVAELADGPLALLDTFADMVEWDAAAMLWYSFWSVIRAGKPGAVRVEAMLNRIAWDLGASGGEHDIASEELVAIGPRPQVGMPVRVGTSHLRVALAPGVVVPLRLQAGDGESFAVGERDAATASRLRKAEQILRDIGRLVESADLQNGDGETGGQPDLFRGSMPMPKKPKKPRRR